MRLQLTAVGLACVTLLSACGGGNEGAKAQFIGFTNPGTQSLPSVPKALGVTSSSNLPVAVTSDTPTICTVVDGNVIPIRKGACSITALQIGNADYLPARVQQAFDIVQGANKITFTSPGDLKIDDIPPALVATSASGLPVNFTSNTTSICTVSGTTLTLVSGGECAIVANQDGNSDYVEAQKTVKFNIIESALLFVSAYSSAGKTKDGGGIETYAAFPATGSVATDASTYTFSMTQQSDVTDFNGYYGFRFNAPVPNPVPAGFTPGVQIVDQAAMKFNILMNPEMVAANATQPNTTRLRVWLYLKHTNNGCDVKLEKWMAPELVAGVLKEQSIDLSTFTVLDCGLPNLVAATELHTYPIFKIEFNVDEVNDQVPNAGTNIYTTSLTMGSIKFK
jgi:hypothetical protein